MIWRREAPRLPLGRAMSDWIADLPPEQQLHAMHNRLRQAGDVYLDADLRARDAGRTRARALDLMRDLRGQMRNLAAEHGLELPPLRWAALLDDDG